MDDPGAPEMVRSEASLSSRIEQSPVGGPQAHAAPHLSATGRTDGDARCRGREKSWLAMEGVGVHDHQADGVGRDGPAGMQQADGADLHTAIGPDMPEEPAEKCNGVESGGAWACPAGLTGGEGDGRFENVAYLCVIILAAALIAAGLLNNCNI